ncbi:MAG: GDP-mannose 4,6-dehydratase, partial [Ketobacter sp.]
MPAEDLFHRYLITGGTGFIGSNLVRSLVVQGKEVHLLVRPGSSLWRIDDI